MQFRIRRISLLLALALSSGAALATNGYFQHGYGVKAQGIGGVGIALPQDGLAAATNPAGTAFVADRVDLGVTWFAPKRGAEISGSFGADGGYDGNGKENFVLPELGYIRHLNPDLSIGLAIYGNGGMNTRYNSGIPLFGNGQAGVNLEQLFISPNVAWKINERHALGAALNFAYQRFEAKGLQNFDPAFTTSPGNVTNRGADSSTGWGIRLGWTGQITPELTLGATWSSKIKASKFDKYKGLFADSGSFDIPENYGIGLAYKPTPQLTLAADLEEILYSDVKSVGLPLANISNGLGARNGAGFGWKDTTVYKVGISYDYSKDLSLRIGYNHSSQPIPSSQTLFNILAPGTIQDHLSLGATYKVGQDGEFSVAYTHGFKKTVKGSGSIPAGFGGGEADIHLEENILGLAYGLKF
ncbi:OmpP1/FadL family transporter [Quatrionicoccus australiensis]|uniref:OmpP1/FadL family transporter n=1 Tax=Quatrionicoccus australiensis TaxID=138118 RepID=UPI001CF94702|nr:outer membrane protein transport protein [Quatrionicoccus australiensis]MCB4359487.1 outer membrane protein transport protein [Quatrionicoccus australiensis]